MSDLLKTVIETVPSPRMVSISPTHVSLFLVFWGHEEEEEEEEVEKEVKCLTQVFVSRRAITR